MRRTVAKKHANGTPSSSPSKTNNIPRSSAKSISKMTIRQQQKRRHLIQMAGLSFCVVVTFLVCMVSFQGKHRAATTTFHKGSSDRKWLQSQLLPPNQGKPEDALTHRHLKTLPDFSNGGIIPFYHTYKSGGSTTGMMFSNMADEYEDHFNFTMLREFVRWEEECLPALDLAQKEKKIVLLELHVEHPSPEFPSLVDLAPTLKRWRAEAHRRGLGFFSFTLVREPISHAISTFNFFHVGLRSYDKDWNPWRAQAPTEANLMQQFVPDRQCRMLGSDPESTLSAPISGMWEAPPKPKSDDLYNCRLQLVEDAIWDTLDWVGSTDTLSSQTLPLLSKLLINNATYGAAMKPFKVFKDGKKKIRGVHKDQISPENMAKLKEGTALDRKLYDDVRKNFTFANLGWDKWFEEDVEAE